MEALKFNRFLLNSLVSTFPNYFTFISSSFTPLFVLMVSSSPIPFCPYCLPSSSRHVLLKERKFICLYYRGSPPNVLLRHLLNWLTSVAAKQIQVKAASVILFRVVKGIGQSDWMIYYIDLVPKYTLVARKWLLDDKFINIICNEILMTPSRGITLITLLNTTLPCSGGILMMFLLCCHQHFKWNTLPASWGMDPSWGR